MRIGPYILKNNLIVAPMAGVTDRPFRQLSKTMGAGMAVSEMVASNSLLWGSEKTIRRGNHEGEVEPKVVQIAGSDPQMMAEAALHNINTGAQIIDINMGCPAKKICNVAAGSALLKDEPLVARIVEAVVGAARPHGVPVTLKIRTGWDKNNRNALTVAKIAESAGIASLAIHGRTRACMYTGNAEYETIKAVKAAIGIPVVANGDITTPEEARFVLEFTGADAVMIGRAAQGRPWIFREIAHFLATGELLPEPSIAGIREILLGHLHALHAFYGEESGVRIARKHLGWYAKDRPENIAFRAVVNRAETAEAQLRLTRDYFDALEAGIALAVAA